MTTIKRIQCDFYCNGCKQEGPHFLIYSNNVLLRSECAKCGREIPFCEQTLLTLYAQDIVQRILTKPKRVSEELKKDLHRAILTLPARIITKPYRLVKEVEEVVDENKKGKGWNNGKDDGG
ncbi:MAG: bh protein [Clostridia bacterium]|nr:bh protein [Clostridia bacterium]MDD4146531.1 bh protein [Clostridia bacterium]MDD4665541.1 bh protein [Clostridia bacterium]